MAVLNLRTAAVLAVGVGIGAALARRHQPVAEACCEKPAAGARCC